MDATANLTTPAAHRPMPTESVWRDYLALAKPRITLLIVLVAVAGYALASPGVVSWVPLLLLVGFGACASSGAAMLNHYFDRDVDARMRRTRLRPLPAARIAPSQRVAVVGFGLTAVGVVGAAVWINPLTGAWVLAGALTYVVVYTIWLKRRSSWNIVIGGFAGSAPALAGSAAAVGHVTPGVWAFALLVFLWTPPHFWSLALLLREDYRAANLPMLPRMTDPKFSGRVVVISAALLVPATAAIGLFAPVGWVVEGVLLALAVGFVVATAPLWTQPVRRNARRGFVYSATYLLAVVAVLLANSVWVAVRPM
jgi:protoheme IX farnesyltransferase